MKDRSYKTILSEPSDLEQLQEIFVLATDHLLEQGIKQWNYTYPIKKDLLRDINRKESYKLVVDQSIAGTVCINEEQDEQYQNITWVYHGKILVIHRVAVHPKFYGNGFGKELCAFAIQYAKHHNYDAIRLDAYSGNPFSNRVYERLGFIKAEGFCYFHGSKIPFNCWEFKVI